MNVAIITAITPPFLDQFKLFISSLRQVSKIPVICLICDDDRKISVSRQYECTEERFDDSIIDQYKKIGDRWIQWFKPDIINKIAVKHQLDIVLWLDADIVVLKDMSPLVSNIEQSFTVIQDYFAPNTTYNDPHLYDIHPSSNLEPEKALNSGVVGLALPRDQYILDEWNKRSQMAADDERVRKCISLYDQGTLIWAMKELGILEMVLDRREWNHAPIRHVYEASPNVIWPFGDQTMGGDLFSEMRYDNPNAIIAHFAGEPKITDLLIPNHKKSVVYAKHISAAYKIPTKHVFVVGLERAGTHTLAEVIRKSAKHGSWVRHEASTKDDHLNSVLSYQAFCKYRGIQTDNADYIYKRIGHYNRSDVNIICDSNHRLGFFIDEIKSILTESKFILLLRSPINLIKSRIANYCLWPALINRYPLDYQLQLFNIHSYFSNTQGSYGQNLHRIFPSELVNINEWQADIFQMHLWEIITTIELIMTQLKKLPPSEYQVLWIDNLPAEVNKLRSIINEQYLWFNQVQSMAHRRFGVSLKPKPQIDEWIDNGINCHYKDILHQFNDVINKYDIKYNNPTLI